MIFNGTCYIEYKYETSLASFQKRKSHKISHEGSHALNNMHDLSFFSQNVLVYNIKKTQNKAKIRNVFAATPAHYITLTHIWSYYI